MSDEKETKIEDIIEEGAPPVVMGDGSDKPNGPTRDEYKEVLSVTAGLAHALENSGISPQVGTSAAMLLAAELAAQSDHSNKQIIESFRRTFVAARKRWREAQN